MKEGWTNEMQALADSITIAEIPMKALAAFSPDYAPPEGASAKSVPQGLVSRIPSHKATGPACDELTIDATHLPKRAIRRGVLVV